MEKIKVAVNQIRPDDSEETLAAFVVSKNYFKVEKGGRAGAVKNIPVIDTVTGEQITSDSDPIRWAKLLPSAFRSGDVYAKVESV